MAFCSWKSSKSNKENEKIFVTTTAGNWEAEAEEVELLNSL